MGNSVNVVLATSVMALAAVACGDGTGDGGSPDGAVEKEILVAHFVSDCVGVGPQECLNVRESTETEWTLWYDGIAGFEHEAGNDYRLLIRETTVDNPPADGSSIRWTLVSILETTPVAKNDSAGDPILRVWKLESFGPAADLGDEAAATLVEGALASLPANDPVTLGLAGEGRVGGFDGCNRYFGDFAIENGHRIVQGPKGATMMACPGGRMELEQAFLRNLESATRVFLRGEYLELENDDGVVLVFAPWESRE